MYKNTTQKIFFTEGGDMRRSLSILVGVILFFTCCKHSVKKNASTLVRSNYCARDEPYKLPSQRLLTNEDVLKIDLKFL